MGDTKRNIVGLKVREMRLAQTPPLTQDALSAKLARSGIQIDRAGISKIENGSRQVCDFELKALARILKTSTDRLLGD